MRNLSHHVAVVGIENQFDIRRSCQHAVEHAVVAFLGECLKFLSQVAVVAVGTDRDASADGGIQILGMPLPLLEGVVLEELFVELPANLGNDDLLGIGGVFDGDALGGKPCLKLIAGALAAKELLEGVEVDREVPVAPVGVAEDLVVDGMPLGELREILDDARGICPEVVRTIFMNENPGLVVLVLGIATNVAALLNDCTLGPKLTR